MNVLPTPTGFGPRRQTANAIIVRGFVSDLLGSSAEWRSLPLRRFRPFQNSNRLPLRLSPRQYIAYAVLMYDLMKWKADKFRPQAHTSMSSRSRRARHPSPAS